MLIPVRRDADILPAYRNTPVETLLKLQNLGAVATGSGAVEGACTAPRLLISTCVESDAVLRLPAGFAIVVRTGAASLKRDPFLVSWAVGIAGVSAIAVIGHDDCQLTGLAGKREAFIERMTGAAGWERPAAEQHFDHWSDLFGIEDPEEAVAAEAARLQARYPGIVVAPLVHCRADGTLAQSAAAV